MKNRVLPFLFVCVVNTFPMVAQIKNYIPILRPVQYAKTKETFENIAQRFEQKNYNDLAEIFRSFALGGHGSGFVYVDTDGENYIITNRHVVANAEFVNMEFIGKGSTKIVYESCPIVYTDNNIDLAVVKFPDNEKVFTKSLSISKTKQLDGQEIWSAGFPGLLGKPVWQFAKGNITNDEAYVEQLVNPAVSYLIQHSASIDPGNSGGPILIKDANGDADEYSVIGVNTWTITNRQNTFFAIPAKNIPDLISRAKRILALKQRKDSLRFNLISQCKLFAAEINSDKPKWDAVLGSISYAFVGEKGWDSFITMLNDSSPEELKEIESKFFNYNPIEAMRYSILYQIWKRFYRGKEKLSVVQFNSINLADEQQFALAKPVRTTFLINGTEHEIEWAFEHGHWRISNYNFDKYLKKEVEKDSYEDRLEQRKKDRESTVYLGVSAFMSPITYFNDESIQDNFKLMGYGGSLNMTLRGIALFVSVNSISLNNKMKNPPITTTEVSTEFLQVTQGLKVYLARKKFKPYLQMGISYMKYSEKGKYNTVSSTNTFEFSGVQVGAGLQYKISKRFGVFAEWLYFSKKVLDLPMQILFDSSTDSSLDFGNAQAAFGITFDFRKK